MYEPNYSPYPLIPPCEAQNPGAGWYEHDGQVRFLIESQTKMMSMVEKMSERIGVVEKAVSNIAAVSPSSAGSSASPEEKKRVPNQLSVSSYAHLLLSCEYSGLWLCFMMLFDAQPKMYGTVEIS